MKNTVSWNLIQNHGWLTGEGGTRILCFEQPSLVTLYQLNSHFHYGCLGRQCGKKSEHKNHFPKPELTDCLLPALHCWGSYRNWKCTLAGGWKHLHPAQPLTVHRWGPSSFPKLLSSEVDYETLSHSEVWLCLMDRKGGKCYSDQLIKKFWKDLIFPENKSTQPHHGSSWYLFWITSQIQSGWETGSQPLLHADESLPKFPSALPPSRWDFSCIFTGAGGIASCLSGHLPPVCLGIRTFRWAQAARTDELLFQLGVALWLSSGQRLRVEVTYVMSGLRGSAGLSTLFLLSSSWGARRQMWHEGWACWGLGWVSHWRGGGGVWWLPRVAQGISQNISQDFKGKWKTRPFHMSPNSWCSPHPHALTCECITLATTDHLFQLFLGYRVCRAFVAAGQVLEVGEVCKWLWKYLHTGQWGQRLLPPQPARDCFNTHDGFSGSLLKSLELLDASVPFHLSGRVSYVTIPEWPQLKMISSQLMVR